MVPKLTDSEIIEAVNYCARDDADCDKCPANNYCNDYSCEMVKCVRDFINRQEADKIKAVNTALKKYAGKLKEQQFDCDVSLGYGRETFTKVVSVLEIDNILEEMAGESNG